MLHARAAFGDAVGAARDSRSFPKERYLERKRLRGESDRFCETWDKASFIGGWLGRPGAELLFELAAAVPPEQDVVELGSYVGRSAAFLALGANPACTLHTVDLHDESTDTAKLFGIHMEMLGVADRVDSSWVASVEGARSYKGRPVGLLFVDAEHTEKAVVEDGRAWSAHLAPGGFVAFDDVKRPGVLRGVKRLASEGVLPEMVGRVGKIGICGPVASWPERVRAIATTT